MGLFRRKPEKEHPSPQQAPAPPSAARTPEASPAHAPLDVNHPVFQLEPGMGTAAVVQLLGEGYLPMSFSQILPLLQKSGPVTAMDDEPSESWLYGDTPAGHNVELTFRSGALDSAKVLKKNADGTMTVLMAMDRDKVEAAPPYQAFVDREIQRRAVGAAPREAHQPGKLTAAPTPETGKLVERVVILHAGQDPMPLSLS
jgi:hypothetical protein